MFYDGFDQSEPDYRGDDDEDDYNDVLKQRLATLVLQQPVQYWCVLPTLTVWSLAGRMHTMPERPTAARAFDGASRPLD